MSAAAGGDDAEPSAARAALRSSWELAAVLNFFQVFAAQLEFTDELRAEELEDALLQRGCPHPLLHELHRNLLQGMHPRSTFRSWRVTLADKLRHEWPELADGECPLASASAADAEEVYDSMTALNRVRALRALCELRLDTPGDLRDFMEDDEVEDPPDFHGSQCFVGQDNRGARYFYQGLDSGPRLYRERSRVGAALKRRLEHDGREGDGPVTRAEEHYLIEPGPMLLEGWEVVACTGEAVAALAADLRNDKFPGSRNAKLCASLDTLAEEVSSKLKRDELKRARIARQRMEAAAACIDWEEGRPRRARQQVDYTLGEYDRQFAGVLRGGRGRAEPEPENLFVRRGRSAAAFADGVELAELPDNRRPRSGVRRSDDDDDSGSEDSDSAEDG